MHEQSTTVKGTAPNSRTHALDEAEESGNLRPLRHALVVRGRRRRASSRGSATSRSASPSRSASEGAMGTSHADGAPDPAGRGGRYVLEVRIVTGDRQSHRGSYCALAITLPQFPLVFRHSRSRCVYQTGERRCRTQPVPNPCRVNDVSQQHAAERTAAGQRRSPAGVAPSGPGERAAVVGEAPASSDALGRGSG